MSKMSKRKILLVVMCIILVLSSSLVACSKGNENGEKSDSNSNSKSNSENKKDDETKNEGESEVVEEVTKISMLTCADMALQDSYVTVKLPEILKEYGFNVEFEMVTLGTHTGNEWREKFSLMISSGQEPADVMQVYSGANFYTLIDSNYAAEITLDMIEENMPRYYTQVNNIYDKMWVNAMDASTGQLYGIPSYNTYGPTRHTVAYRKDWLEELNMDIPETLDDFEEFLIAVRENDPNGNGEKDEFGYTSGTDQTIPMFSEVFAAYGVMPYQWMELDDGTVSMACIQPEAKEALTVLVDWYSRDLIPKGILTTTRGDEDFFADKLGCLGCAKGYAPFLLPGGRVYEAIQKIDGAEVVGAPGPRGPDGDYGTWANGPKKYIVSFGKHLEGNEEKIATIMQLFETIASTRELFELTTFGERGIHWDFADPNANMGSVVFKDEYKEQTVRLEEVGVRELSESAFCPIWLEEIYKNYIDPLAWEYAHQNPGIYDPLLGVNGEIGRSKSTDLWNLTQAAYLEIIRGEKDISYFDEYVKEWLANGGQEMIDEQNEIYNKLFVD